LNILLVDDDQDFAESLEEVLSTKGHTVSLCFDPIQALNQFDFTLFDLFILDIKMKGMNGVELFFKIKQRAPNAKVLMVTAYSLQTLLDQAEQNGVLGVLQKPVQFDKLFMFIDSAAKPLILIVDDNEDFCESIEETLQKQGYRTLTAFSGEQAWQQCQQSDCDIIILDINLPDINGFQLLARISAYKSNIPIIIVTAYADEFQQQISELFGASSSSRFFTKPVDTINLLNGIGMALTC